MLNSLIGMTCGFAIEALYDFLLLFLLMCSTGSGVKSQQSKQLDHSRFYYKLLDFNLG